MIRGICGLSAVIMGLLAVPALGDGPNDGHLAFRGGLSAGETAPTESMWFYEQYQRNYNDAELQVHRNAESRATQRRNRLSSLRWFGFSNTRPRSGGDPWHGDYSPHWAGNNAHYPYRWQGTGWPRITIRNELNGVASY